MHSNLSSACTESDVSQSDLKRLINELRPIPADKINELGTQLKVPYHKMKEFEHNYPCNSERVKSEILKFWIDNTDNCSWDDVADAIDEIGFKNIARKLVEHKLYADD